MRKSLMTRLLLALAIMLTGALVVTARAAPAAQPPAPAYVATARVALVHAAPFDATTTDVTITATRGSETAILSQGFLDPSTGQPAGAFDFGKATPYTHLPADNYQVKVFTDTLTLAETLSATPVLSAALALAEGEDYTVVASGTGAAPFPLALEVYTDTLPEATATQGLLRVIHAAPFNAAGPTGTTIDVVPNAGGTPVVDDLDYGNASDFLPLAAGSYDLEIRAVDLGNSVLLDPPAIDLGAGDVITLIAVGDGTNEPVSLLRVDFNRRAEAKVRVVHAAPFAAGAATASVLFDPSFTTLDVTPFAGLDFGEASIYKPIAPGLFDLKLIAGDSITGTAALSRSLTLSDGQQLTVVVVGTNTTTYPLDLAMLSDNPNAPAGSATAAVRIFHAAPFAPSPAASGVDVVSQDGSPLSPPITDLTYLEATSFAGPPASQYTTLPSGTPLDLKLVQTGAPATTVIDPPALTLSAGSVQTIIAIGGANSQAGALLTLNDQQATQQLFMPLVAKS